jgi:hypothetical protein
MPPHLLRLPGVRLFVCLLLAAFAFPALSEAEEISVRYRVEERPLRQMHPDVPLRFELHGNESCSNLLHVEEIPAGSNTVFISQLRRWTVWDPTGATRHHLWRRLWALRKRVAQVETVLEPGRMESPLYLIVTGDGIEPIDTDCQFQLGAGLRGPTGPTGPAGSSSGEGTAGPAGPQGPQGPAGPPGAAGATAADGTTGPAGAAGAQGPQGPQGPMGTTGPAGPMGPTGAAGATGSAGLAGADGAQGPPGVAGADGAPGAQGPAGPAGSAGPQGPQGPQGPTGLRGATGLTGATGPAGSPGLPGTPGAPGSQGPEGPEGPAGPDPFAFYEHAASEPESSTTSGTWVQKLRMTTSVLPAGNYRIGYSMELTNSHRAGTSDFRVEVNDATTLTEASSSAPAVSNRYSTYGGFAIVPLAAGKHAIDIDFKTNASNTASMRRVRLELHPVP